MMASFTDRLEHIHDWKADLKKSVYKTKWIIKLLNWIIKIWATFYNKVSIAEFTLWNFFVQK